MRRWAPGARHRAAAQLYSESQLVTMRYGLPMTSTLHRTPLATAGLALVVALGGCGGGAVTVETPP